MSSVAETDFMRKLLEASEASHRPVFVKANELDRIMVAYMYWLTQMTRTIHENGKRMTPQERAVEFAPMIERFETAIEEGKNALRSLIETEVRIQGTKTKWLGWVDAQFAFFATKKQEIQGTYVPHA